MGPEKNLSLAQRPTLKGARGSVKVRALSADVGASSPESALADLSTLSHYWRKPP